MTGAILKVVVETKGPLVLRAVLWASTLILLPIAVAVDLVGTIRRSRRRRGVLSVEVALCPAGHEVVLTGLWKCGCGMSYDGHAFQSCMHCAETAHAITCACGRQVVNPLSGVFG